MKKIFSLSLALLLIGAIGVLADVPETYDRWTSIIGKTIEARDNIQAFDDGNGEVDLSEQLAELQTKIDTMTQYRDDLNVEEGRKSENNSGLILAFKQTTHEAKEIITPILREHNLDRTWNDLRKE